MYVCIYICIGTMYRIRIEFASTNINPFITYIYQLCQPLSPITFNNLWLWSSSVPIHTLVVGAARPSDMDDHLESAQLYR